MLLLVLQQFAHAILHSVRRLPYLIRAKRIYYFAAVSVFFSLFSHRRIEFQLHWFMNNWIIRFISDHIALNSMKWYAIWFQCNGVKNVDVFVVALPSSIKLKKYKIVFIRHTFSLLFLFCCEVRFLCTRKESITLRSDLTKRILKYHTHNDTNTFRMTLFVTTV